MSSRFLFKDALWKELAVRIPKAKRVRAAVAYVGTGGSRLLPLRRGDLLVVDMSLRSVGAGATNPSEIQKMLGRGVQVFTRDSLHAKFFIIDRVVIAGSSNVSRHAKDYLDEAALLATDEASRREAEMVFDGLCVEPVSAEYLARCIKAYRPPRHETPLRQAREDRRRSGAKVWLLPGHTYGDVPDEEVPKVTPHVQAASKRLQNYKKFEVDYVHYPRPQPFLQRLRFGDWVVVGISSGRGIDIDAPARVLGVTSYPRGEGRRRYVLLLEKHAGSTPVRWTQVRSALGARVPSLNRLKPRSRPLTHQVEADALLALWNNRGRFKGGSSR